MHMPNEILSLPVAGAFGVLAVGGLAFASSRAKKNFPDSKIPLMGVMGAFVFAAQMVNFPVLMGASGHLVGAVLLAILLGPSMAALTVSGILIIQCLLFQDGGILALGANIFNMAIVANYGGYFFFKLVVGKKEQISPTKLFLGCFIGSTLGVVLASLFVPLEVGLSGISDVPIPTFLLMMGGMHLLIGLTEGVITGTVILAIGASHPQFLSVKVDLKERVKPAWVVLVIGLVALLTAGGLSLIASKLPDGLEWSIAKWNPQISTRSLASPTAKGLVNIQKKSSLLPGYGHPQSKAKYWTSFAGIVGAILAGLLALLISLVRRKKNPPLENSEKKL